MDAAEPKARALVVDDSGVARRVLCAHLRERAPELEIDTAEDGRQALELFDAGAYDVIFLDITMPVMDGLDALREIRKRGRGVVVVIVSAGEVCENTRRAARYGASAFISKPYSALHIQSALKLAGVGQPALNILIIDDSRTQRAVLRATLEAVGLDCRIDEAGDGPEGLRKYFSEGPDLVFLDLNMPRLGGEDVLKEMKAAGAFARIVMLSADERADVRDACGKLGADAFLSKPISPAAVVRTVYAMLDVSGSAALSSPSEVA